MPEFTTPEPITAAQTTAGRIQLDRIAGLRGRLAAGEVATGHIAGTADIEGGEIGIGEGTAASVDARSLRSVT